MMVLVTTSANFRRLKHTSFAIALILVLTSMGFSQPIQTDQDRPPDIPIFRVQIWGDAAADFSLRVRSYVELRSELEKGLPALGVSGDPAEIMRTVNALAKRIRVARAKARQGDIFTPAITVEFKKALLREMNASTWADIVDDNPGAFSNRINAAYPRRKSLSTVPPNILAVLPILPGDIEYRFVGRHLILLDTRANVIIDRIPYAIQCPDRDGTGDSDRGDKRHCVFPAR